MNAEETRYITEKIYERILSEYTQNKKRFNGSHPEDSYEPYDLKWFDLPGMTTWDENRQTTKKYLKDIGLL